MSPTEGLRVVPEETMAALRTACLTGIGKQGLPFAEAWMISFDLVGGCLHLDQESLQIFQEIESGKARRTMCHVVAPYPTQISVSLVYIFWFSNIDILRRS